jgi:hypothetical protein
MRAALALVLVTACAAPGPPSAGPPAGAPTATPLVVDSALLPEGAVLEARADHTIATEYSKAGQVLTATVETPIVDRAGRRALPKGTQVVLRVEALAQGKGATPGRLEVVPVAVRTWCNGVPTERAIDARVSSAEIAQLPEDRDAADVIDRSADSGFAFGAMVLGIPGAAAGQGAAAAGSTARVVAGRVVNARLGEGARLEITLETSQPIAPIACTVSGAPIARR